MTEEEINQLPFLPEKGVCGTLYLYLQPWGRWGLVTWDNKSYHTHGQTMKDPLEGNYMGFDQIEAYADEMRWAKGWPRVICRAVPEKINPTVRVEFETKDGRVQRLTGAAADEWVKMMNDVLVLSALRYGQDGQTKISDWPWEYITREE